MRRRAAPLVANRRAGILWAFSAVWLGMLGLVTVAILRDGPPEGYPPELIRALLGLFWIGGLCLVALCAHMPMFLATATPEGRLRLTWRYPHRRRRQEHEAAELALPPVEARTDSDGETQYRAVLLLPDGSEFVLAEGRSREACAAARHRVAAAIPALSD